MQAAADSDHPVVTQPWLSTSTRRKRRFCSRFPDGDEGELLRLQHQFKKKQYKRKGQQPWVLRGGVAPGSRDQLQFCRRHGFERPFNTLQVLSWVFFIIDIVLGCLVLPWAFPRPWNFLYLGVFVIIAVTVVSLACIITRIDPSDPLLFSTVGDAPRNIPPNAVYCDLCQEVYPESKHCRSCNKCVARFDHHCKWLNNCIGSANYVHFLFLISFTLLLSLHIIIGAFVAIILAALGKAAKNWSWPIENYHSAVIYSISSFLILVNVPIFVLDAQLVLLHGFLVRKGWTTFEYITQRVKPKESESSEAFCCEWIIIDKKRMKRAREKWRGGGTKQTDESDVGQKPNPIGVAPHVPRTFSPSDGVGSGMDSESDVFAAPGKPTNHSHKKVDTRVGIAKQVPMIVQTTSLHNVNLDDAHLYSEPDSLSSHYSSCLGEGGFGASIMD